MTLTWWFKHLVTIYTQVSFSPLYLIVNIDLHLIGKNSYVDLKGTLTNLINSVTQ